MHLCDFTLRAYRRLTEIGCWKLNFGFLKDANTFPHQSSPHSHLNSFSLAKNYFLQVTVCLLILQTTGTHVGCVSRGLWTGMVTHIVFQDYFCLFHEGSKNSSIKRIWRRTAQSVSFFPNVSGREMSQLHVRAALQHISVKFSNLDWKWASGTIVDIFLTYSSQNLASHSNGSFLEFLRMQADIISFNLIPNFDTDN